MLLFCPLFFQCLVLCSHKCAHQKHHNLNSQSLLLTMWLHASALNYNVIPHSEATSSRRQCAQGIYHVFTSKLRTLKHQLLEFECPLNRTSSRHTQALTITTHFVQLRFLFLCVDFYQYAHSKCLLLFHSCSQRCAHL